MDHRYWYNHWLMKQLSRRRLMKAGAVGAAGVAGYALVGCGDDDDDDDDDDDRPEQEETGAPEEEGTGAAEDDELAEEQVIRIFSNEPTEIGPGLAPSAANALVRSLCYSGLYVYDENYEVVPGDADGLPESSADGLVHTVRLRSDLTWSDGTPYNANEYVFAIRDVQLGELNNLTSFFVKGVPDFTFGETTDVNVLGLRAVDDLTLEIETLSPAPFIAAFLAGDFTWWPIPRHKYEEHGAEWGLQEDRVFNGPYQIETWENNQRIVFTRNAGYNGPPANLDRIEATIFPDQYGPAVLAAFEAGELDVANVGQADIRRVLDNPDEFNPETVAILLDLNTIVINTAEPPLDDLRVRQALYLSIDRDLLNESLYEGTYTSIYKYVVGDQPGADPDARPFEDEGVERAQELLAEAGFPDGEGFPELTYISYGGDYLTFGEALKEMWEENLGISIRIQSGDEAAWVAAVIEADQLTWGQLADAFPSQTFLDPAALLDFLLDNGGVVYHHNWEYPQGLLEQKQEALAAQGDERHEKVLAFDLEATREVPIIPVHQFSEVYVRRSNVVGQFQSNAFAWQGLRYVRILQA
jgi:oligopeptide transport system substrate-binding protein